MEEKLILDNIICMIQDNPSITYNDLMVEMVYFGKKYKEVAKKNSKELRKLCHVA